jgi:two-component system LytT family response regulator
MLKITICDDNAKDRKQIEDNLRAYIAAHREHGIEFDIYSTAFEMLDAFEKSGSPDIALLDICMPGMLGTELARDILRCGENTDIIFLTTSSDYAVDAFSIHAADYIQKPYTQEKFNDSLDRVIAMRQDRTWILLQSEGELHRIALEDILYIETRGKSRIFFLVTGKKLTAWLSAAQLQECLSEGKGMVNCGASYVVNLRHVRRFSGTDLVMDNDALIPVPRRLRSQVKQAYFDFYLKEARS